ncbi:MAG: Mth938-like domain-containing protein [Xanthomonadales bacterium]|nr:Mth938-like domain-containing protein [Xanthomonadales bacterium]
MSLQQQLGQGGLRIRRVSETGAAVDDQWLERSFVLMSDQLVHPWPVVALDTISAAHVDEWIALQPEVVLLGTGPRQGFLAPRLQAQLMARGIGIECMDNGAAARTFNLLADEDRRVLVVLLFASGD